MLELNENLKKRNKITTYHILTQNLAQIFFCVLFGKGVLHTTA